MPVNVPKTPKEAKLFGVSSIKRAKKFPFALGTDNRIKVAKPNQQIINKQKGSATTKLIIAGIIGLIFGSFFVLIYDSVRNRARLK